MQNGQSVQLLNVKLVGASRNQKVKSAYESIYREKLLCAMMELGISSKLIRLVKTTITNVQCSVQI
jgi:hypothetical protein